MSADLRCSELDRVCECSGSVVKSRAAFNPNHVLATVGTASHEVSAFVPFDDKTPNTQEIADRYGVEQKDLDILHWFAKRAWKRMKPLMPNPQAELHLGSLTGDGWTLNGTTDLVSTSYSGEVLMEMTVADWKSGYSHDEHEKQLMGYALLARNKFGMPASGFIGAIEAHLRHQELNIQKFSAAQLDGLEELLSRQVKNKRQYAPGMHCKFCPRSLQCDARARWLRATCNSIEATAMDEVSPEVLVALYPRVKLLEKALKQYNDIVNETLALNDGPIAIGDGTQLEMEIKQQESLDYTNAADFIKGFSDAERGDFLKITKGKMMDVISSKAPPRKGAAYVRQAMEELRAMGAVNVRRTRNKRVVKIKEELKEEN